LVWPDETQDDDVVAVQAFSDGAALQFSSEEDPPFFGMGDKGHPVHIWHWKAGWQDVLERRKDIETKYANAACDWYSAQKNYVHGAPFEAGESQTRFHDSTFITGWGAGNPVSIPKEKPAAEEAVSEGLGSYTARAPAGEHVDTKGVWQNGKWHVVFLRPLKSSAGQGFRFMEGQPIHVAFAIWDGADQDRNGQKMVSIWNNFILEE
jgi:hypothetical protein